MTLQTPLSPPSNQGRATPRQAMVLLIVIVMLTLFAVVGLAFVYYAEAESTAAMVSRDYESYRPIEVDPEMVASIFLGKFLYGDRDDAQGVYSAMRGYDLMRGIYGTDYDFAVPATSPQIMQMYCRSAPYSGTGRLHNILGASAGLLNGVDDYEAINYTYYSGDGFLRDPERLGPRLNLAANLTLQTGGLNVPYTYPDLHSHFLAAVRSDGTVLTPSFHREYLFGRLDQFPGTATPNPNWTNTQGKYMTLRPRPIDNPGGFPYPEDRGGDVRNLPYSLGAYGTGGNDSIWIDLDAPIMTAPDGRRYKMLFAPLIVDLDGRINLNYAGNLSSQWNQGWGKWEMDLTQLLSTVAESIAVFQGNTLPGGQTGRYGGAGSLPSGVPLLAPIGTWYSPVDYNGTGTPLILPLPTAPIYAFPSFPGVYGNSTVLTNNNPSRFNLFAPTGTNRIFRTSNMEALLRRGDKGSPALTSELLRLMPNSFAIGGSISSGSIGAATKASPIVITTPSIASLVTGQQVFIAGVTGNTNANGTWIITVLSPTTFSLNGSTGNAAYTGGGTWTTDALRYRVTTDSWDLELPGVTPWAWNPANPANLYTLPQTAAPVTIVAGGTTTTITPPNTPSGAAIPFPALSSRTTTPPAGSEFDPNTWRAVSAALGKVDLNRILPDYPLPANNGTYTTAAQTAQFTVAQTARQTLARDIYNALIVATGSRDPNTQTTTTNPAILTFPYNPQTASTEVQAARWLAQLAVNIVDYLDDDDFMTPFLWLNVTQNNQTAAEYVFGTELPRVLLNEAYIQYDNDANDPGLKNVGQPNANQPPTAQYYKLNAWVELHNPFKTTLAGSNYPSNNGAAVLQSAQAWSNYQLLVMPASVTAGLTTPWNSTGQPAAGTNPLIAIGGATGGTNKAWGPGTTAAQQQLQWQILPANGATSSTVGVNPGGNTGFYVIGPPPSPTTAYLANRNPNLPTPTLASPLMSSQQALNALTLPTTVTILLQRLACPNLAYNALTNPYITVDIMSNVTVNDNRVYNPTMATPNAVTSFSSQGRTQPYSGVAANLVLQKPTPAVNNQPQNTFFSMNTQSTTTPPQPFVAYDWPVQLDRPLISPLELLCVSGVRPHEMTMYFAQTSPTATTATAANPATVGFVYYAPWLNQNSRLYRFFEFVKTHDRNASSVYTYTTTTGANKGAITTSSRYRVPGKVNINTIYDSAVWNALCAHPSAATLYTNMIAMRSPSMSGNSPPFINPTDQDQPSSKVAVDFPFRPFSVGVTAIPSTQYPNGIGINNTLLMAATGNATSPTANTNGLRLFDVAINGTGKTAVAATHPYQQHALLTKLMNNVTVRSNVFAVWVTVGFFQVTNETVTPAQLGAEMNRSENRHIRHRFFAIVDRTSANNTFFYKQANGTVVSAPAAVALTAAVTVINSVPVTATFTVNKNRVPLYTVSGNQLSLGVGSRLVVDQGLDNEEVVVVTAVTAAKNGNALLTAAFRQTHTAAALVTYQGNPGPWANTSWVTGYNPRRDSMVLHLSVVD